VAGGQRQHHKLDVADTFAPVCSYKTMPMILAVIAHKVLWQFEVQTESLNGELEEVYVHLQPWGRHLVVGNKRLLRLRQARALYGLKQALSAWNKRQEGEVRAKGFEQLDTDPALWILRREDGVVLVMFYVDGGLVAARPAAEADALVDLDGSNFEVWKFGEQEDVLGIHIRWDRSTALVHAPSSSTRKTRRRCLPNWGCWASSGWCQ
jgi:hypothetical protein